MAPPRSVKNSSPPNSLQPKPTQPGQKALPKDLEERRQEAEALAKFLLENLS